MKLSTPPTKGSVISGLWKYAVVCISRDIVCTKPTRSVWDVSSVNKFKTLEEARECADGAHKYDCEYAAERGRPQPKRTHYTGEWTMNEHGEIVLVLLDDPEY